MNNSLTIPHIVIIGGGFGGLYAAQELGGKNSKVTLIDKHNYHLFQPLLYQVATGGLSPGDIASPLRGILKKHKNIRVIKAEAIDINPDEKKVVLAKGEIDYDYLIIATGVSHSYFGNEHWELAAPGLKTIEDAVEIRRRVLEAYEAAELEDDPHARRAWMRFVVVGGGPTGVELAGALGELANHTMKNDFRQIDPRQAEIILVEGLNRVLPAYPPELSTSAEAELESLGIQVRTGTLVTDIYPAGVTLRSGDQEEEITCQTVLWAAGMKASSMGDILAKHTGCELDRAGRVIVEPDLSLPGYPHILVIGDLAHFRHQTGEPLPGVAPVAMQQGRYAARLILKIQQGDNSTPFHYRDKGNLAVIGRNAAVADFNFLRLTGFLAWLVWVFVHIAYLIEFDNKLLVLLQWAWNYFTRKRGARLIVETGVSSIIYSILLRRTCPPNTGRSKANLPFATAGY